MRDEQQRPVIATGDDDWPLVERPGFLARRLHQIHVSLFNERCAQFNLTPLQYSLLSVLSRMNEADQTTLAGCVALDRTTTTGALKRLEARGLIRRQMSPSDRRAQTSAITPKGRQLLKNMESAVRDAHAATVAILPPADRQILISLIRQIIEAHEGCRHGEL